MKKNIWFLLGIFYFVFTGCAPPTPIRTNQELSDFVLQESLNSTVAFVVENRNTPGTYSINCSGFFIRPRLILSALHCFQEITVINVEGQQLQIPITLNPINTEQKFVRYSFENSNTLLNENNLDRARIVRVDLEHDLVLLALNDEYKNSHYTLRVSNRMPTQTERVALIGHPIGIPWCINSGIISRILFSRGHWDLLQTSIMISGGYSGGPLIDANGEVLGLADAYLRGNQGISIFVSSARIRMFIDNSGI